MKFGGNNMSRLDQIEIKPSIKILHVKRQDGRLLLINVCSITCVAEVKSDICHIYFGDSSIYVRADYQEIRDFLKGSKIEIEFNEVVMK